MNNTQKEMLTAFTKTGRQVLKFQVWNNRRLKALNSLVEAGLIEVVGSALPTLFDGSITVTARRL